MSTRNYLKRQSIEGEVLSRGGKRIWADLLVLDCVMAAKLQLQAIVESSCNHSDNL